MLDKAAQPVLHSVTMSHQTTHNGHEQPLIGGHGYENGDRVAVSEFDYDEADREWIEYWKEVGRRESFVDKTLFVAAIIQFILDDPKEQLCAESFYFAAGLTEKSEPEIAGKYEVTKQAVCKRVKKWQELLDIPPSAAMRSEKACESFRIAQLKSWQHEKTTQTRNEEKLSR